MFGEISLTQVLQGIEAFEGICIVLGSLFVLALFAQEGVGDRLSNYHIISMIVSDLMQGLFNVPAVIYISSDLRVRDPSCLWIAWGLIVSGFLQVMVIVVMTVDRYWAIVHTMHYRTNANKEITLRLVFGTWIGGLILTASAFLFRIEEKHPDQKCFIMDEMFSETYTLLMTLAFILAPKLVMFYMNFRIYRVVIAAMKEFMPVENSFAKVRKIVAHRENSNSSSSSSSSSPNLKEFRTMMILSLIVGVYFMGWIPPLVFFAFMRMKKSTVNVTGFLITAILNHFHSILNPFLYVLNIPQHKPAARRLIRRLFCLPQK